MKKYFLQVKLFITLLAILSTFTQAQVSERKFSLKTGGTVEVKNLYGQINVQATEENDAEVRLKIDSDKNLSADQIIVDNSDGRLKIEVLPQKSFARIDLILQIPIRSKVKLQTASGQIRVSGNFDEAVAETDTGTIYADVPLENLKYKFLWSASQPRIVSEVILEKGKEKSAGKFVISGKITEEIQGSRFKIQSSESEDNDDGGFDETEAKSNKQKTKDKEQTSLDFRTARGIILLNVPPNEVPSDLSDRPLTDAAKAIIKSGDTLLTEAIRRASPKYFGDYAATLPPRKNTPFLENADRKKSVAASVKKVLVQVVDINNRAIADLSEKDFILTERGDEREILAVEKSTAPFNLVLLLDVSGSIENYVDFIRKAARNFVNTADKQDKISIVIFNNDVKTLSKFTTDKNSLSESLDTFDAGDGTAYYDSLAFVLTETLRPLRGDRTAIVVLSDGDDNRSFLPFNSLLGSIQESGALVYPLYVPSGLIASAEAGNPNNAADPLRNRFLSQSLSSKAQAEGEELAKISGGVYYPIQRLSEIQTAYDDIVKQLRTAYTIKYRSTTIEENGNRASPILKVKVKKENTFVKLGAVVAVENREVSQAVKKN